MEKPMNSGIDSDLIRGHIDTIILKILKQGDRYGYEIVKDVENRSKGAYVLKQPTLYSCLKRLEGQGLISSYWTDSDIGGNRHYYALTELGKQTLESNQQDWLQSKKIIDNLISDSFDKEEDFENEKDEDTLSDINDSDNLSEENDELSSEDDVKDDSEEDKELISDIDQTIEEKIESDSDIDKNDTDTETLKFDKDELDENRQFSSAIIRDDEEYEDFENSLIFDENTANNEMKNSSFNEEDGNCDEISDSKDEDNYDNIENLTEDENEIDADIESDTETVENDTEIEDEIDADIENDTEVVENGTEIEDENDFLENVAYADVEKQQRVIDSYLQEQFLSNKNETTQNNMFEDEDSVFKFDQTTPPIETHINAVDPGEIADTFEPETYLKFDKNGNVIANENTIFASIIDDEDDDLEPSKNITENTIEETEPNADIEFSDAEETLEVETKAEQRIFPSEPLKMFGGSGKTIEPQYTDTEYKSILSKLTGKVIETNDKFEFDSIERISNEKQSAIISKSEFSDTIEEYMNEPQKEYSQLDYTDIVNNFKSLGITIKPHQKIERKKNVLTHIFVNKIKMFKSWIGYIATIVSLLISYIVMTSINYVDNTFANTFSYYVAALLIAGIWPLITTSMYWVDPSKRNTTKYAPRASFLISILFFIQAILIIYAFNLVIGMTTLKDTEYNHLKWIIPLVTSTIIIWNSIAYYFSYKSKKFHC